MRKSPLQLKEYYFPIVSVVANPAFMKEDFDPLVSFEDINVKSDLFIDKNNPNNFQVQLNINIESKADKPSPYNISILCLGMFEADESFPDKEKLVRITGTSILYSAARDFLLMVMSRTPLKKPAMLPSVSFLVEPKEQQASVDKPKKRKKSLN